MVHSVTQRRSYQGVLYFQNDILLYGTRANAISFTPIKKVRPFLRWFSETHKYSTPLCADLFIEFHTNWKINVGSTDRNSFTPLSEVWLSLSLFPWNPNHSINFCGHLLYRDLSKSGEKVEKFSLYVPLAHFLVTHSCSTSFWKKNPTPSFMKSDKRFSRWYQVTDRWTDVVST